MIDIEDTYKTSHLLIHSEPTDNPKSKEINDYVMDLIAYLQDNPSVDNNTYKHYCHQLKRKYKIAPSTASLNYVYRNLVYNNMINMNTMFETFNIRKKSRSDSGITQITVMSSPHPNGEKFSCEHNCYYCPNEPAHEGNGWVDQPRSYLYNEPAVRRGNMNNFDGANQMWDRMSVLSLCGHDIDKLEVMVLGGTWGSYPVDYRINFIRDLYYAANTFYIDKRRERLTLEEEIDINMVAPVRIIGLTLETRPDHVTANELMLLRQMNCTRVQIGVQHLDDTILKKINRGCYLSDTKRAIRNLLNCGLKVDIHIMFDLPFSSPEIDREMIIQLLHDNDLRFDQMKLYPFESLDWTETKKWEDNGQYLHYNEDDLVENLLYTMKHIHPWVRINRIIRDIPSQYIHAGICKPNARQDLDRILKNRGIYSMDIRNREVGSNIKAINQINDAIMMIRSYHASDGIEYFISMESPDNKYIYGFCRLRLSDTMGYVDSIEPAIRHKKDTLKNINLFSYLNGCAMIRELHVYGDMTPVTENGACVQHRGFGKMMLRKAEEIAIMKGYKKMAIISGVGARKYYEKNGYHLYDTYMIKRLTWHYHIFSLIIIIIAFIWMIL